MSLVDVSLGTAYAGREANHALSFRQFNKSKHAQYFTPQWLADLVFEILQPLVPTDGPSVLSVFDPTVGAGRLLHSWRLAGASVLGIELDEKAAEHARYAIGPQNVRAGDILEYRNLVENFSLVVTNPPYGIYWDTPDAGEVWKCETSGGKLESQGATLEIATRAVCYGGYLVAIIPTSTFTNAKDRFLRDVLYTNFEGLLQATIPKLFEEEYGINVLCDVVIARKVYRGSAPWSPHRVEINPENAADELRIAARRALYGAEKIPASTPAPVPVLSRLTVVSASRSVRVTPKGIKSSADADGLLQFLDETVTAFDPVRGIEHGIVSALLSPASLLTIGPRAGVETLAWLGFDPQISEADAARISSLQSKYALLKTPLYPPPAHQRLAYIEDRAYPAKATVPNADGTPCFTIGRLYHLRPSWVRNRETASVETVFDEREGKDVTLITTVDRGYLSFEVLTDSGARTFREVDAADVELLTAAFDLPEVPDLEAVVPARLAQNRKIVARVAPYLFPFQAEDVARLAVKPCAAILYEQGGGKTCTAAAWAKTRGCKRVLVVCQSSLVENWMNELKQFGFPAQRLTTHAAVTQLVEEKRRRLLPDETTFYVTSFEFLSLVGPKQYDAWECRTFTKDGAVHHSVTDNTKASCRVCKRAYQDVIDVCPKCGEAAAWTGGHCNTCGYQAWTATADTHQWPAYKRVKKLFSAVLVDEAQIIKSKNTLRGRAVRALKPSKRRRVIMSGTWMKGFITDIFHSTAMLLGFDNPCFPYAYRGGTQLYLREFGSFQFVTRQFADSLSQSDGRARLLPEVSNLNRFWRLLAPFSVRRRKDDIYVLPAKERRIHLLNMDEAHGCLYRGYAEWAQNAIAKALRESDGNPNMGVISGALWKLRYAATCPVAVDYLDRGVLDATTWNKLEKVREIVRHAADRGEKTIVFSGLRTMVAAIVKHLRLHGLGVLPITAEVQAKKRFALVQEFSRSPDTAAIVASLNCLNRGFTITAANHVVIVDLEYSPEATEQAEDRVHRPGQSKPVYIHYLLGRDTIDQVMHEVLVQKSEAIRHAIDGKARFIDVAEILKRATGDVQLEIAKRIELLPVPDVHPQLGIVEEAPIHVPVLVPADAALDLPVERLVIRTVQQLSLFG